MHPYLFVFLVFAIGFILGGISMWFQIRTYRRGMGMNPDPLEVSTIHMI